MLDVGWIAFTSRMFLGFFFITVMWLSFISPLLTPLTINCVWVAVSRSVLLVPAIHVFILIFLGSELLSVQNKRSSRTFIPVIIFCVNFNVSCLTSTKTTLVLSSSKLYCNIASTWSCFVTNQYKLLVFSSETLAIHV